jgi:copper homeostasis protein
MVTYPSRSLRRSVGAALAAQAGGAAIVELCADLLEGGCTPARRHSAARSACRSKLTSSSAARRFCYSEAEFQAMKLDIALCKQAGMMAVISILHRTERSIEMPRARISPSLGRSCDPTAFDMTRDPMPRSRT